MKTFGKMALACGVVALMAVPASAQQGRGGRGFGGGGVALLSNKSVQAELKATDEQAEKLNTFATEMMGKQREALQDIPQEERREKMQELARTWDAEMMKAAGEILKPEQVKRFRGIQLQQAGVAAFAMPRVQEGLKLTDDQKTKLREFGEELRQAMQEAFQEGQTDREGAMKKIAELRKQATEKAHAVLTEDQKKAWKEMVGEPFEVVYERRAQN